MNSVTVLCPNARRCPVKVTPGMLMRQVLEEACLKNGFDADSYQLSHQKRHVDLALPFRLSGLPNNATLEMVQADVKCTPDSKVTIALQIPNGSRMEKEFPVSTSLFSILESFSLSFGEDLMTTSDSSTPSCSYMNRKYTGPEELRRTTLSSIGISSGKCLIRYQRIELTKEQLEEIAARVASEAAEKQALLSNYAKKKAENDDREKLEADRLARFEEEIRLERERREAMEREKREEPMEISNPAEATLPAFSRDLLGSPPRNSSGWSFDAPVFSNAPHPNSDDRLNNLNRLLQQVDTSLNTPHQGYDRITNLLAESGRVPLSRIAVEATAMEEENVATAVSPAFAAPCERQPVVFRRQADVKDNIEENITDDFFDVGVEDLKARQRDLREEVRTNVQRALVPTQYVKEKNREKKMAAYCHTVIRIPLGSERMIQAQFRSAEPVSRLFEWIRSIIARPVSFSLKFPLNHELEESEVRNFVDTDLAPKSTILIKFVDSSSFESNLREGMFQECTHDEADRLGSEWLSQNTVFKPYTAVVEEDERTAKRPASIGSEFAPPQKSTGAPSWLRKK